MNIKNAILTRRSTRKYKAIPLDKETINKVVEAGRYAPSGGNSQNTHFIVITNKEILVKLQENVKKAFASMEITPGMYKSMANSIRLSKSGTYIYDYNAPVLIITANKKEYGNNMADISCALENMMIMANELDLGSCWINQLRWLNENETILNIMYELGMDPSERVYGALALGIADTEDGLPNRNPLPRTGNKVTYID
ncbi:MAG: nitroreductase [Bacilli bacterium]|nr:nitroreductase [Bacilli bacterium]